MTPERKITATPKLHFHPDKSYILIGGTGLVGLELVDWLIRKGATKIVINARKSVTIGYKALCFHKWSKRKDVKIVTSSHDCVTLSGNEKLIANAVKLGPVGGKYRFKNNGQNYIFFFIFRDFPFSNGNQGQQFPPVNRARF